MGYIINFLIGLICAQNAQCWSATSGSTKTITEHQATDITTYLGLALCPLRFEPWSCARTLSARVLDDWNYELNKQWEKLKVEADQQLNTTLQMRGYSSSDGLIKEKPSTMLKKIEIGTQYIKKYLGESMNVSANGENETDDYVDEIDDRDVDAEGDGDEESSENNNEESPNEDHDDHKPTENELTEEETKDVLDGNEFIEIDATSPNGDLKHPSIGGKKKINKKKKGDQNGQPATLVVVQASDHTPNSHIDHDEHDVHEDQDKPLKQKRKKNKKKHQHGGGHESNVIAEHDTSNHIGLGLLEELIGDESLSSGGKRKKKGHPSKYGRSNGVTRGKKKKKKKALMKLVLIGSFLKAKIELLLKILGSHLQIKFFAIALIGLLINIARFWIEVKRGGAPQKVVYVEHAHHQHHYEDHGEDWNEQGGYWKRSLQTASGLDEPTSTDTYHPQPQDHPHNLAYRNYWQ